jgi:hypothetical protein
MPIEILADASSNVYAAERQHYRNAGTIALPVYGNPPVDNPQYPNGGTDATGTGAIATPCRIVRLHAPVEWMIIVWQTVKTGAAPVVPNPYLLAPNLVFKQGRRSGSVPIDIPGQTGHSWSMSGEYHYHMSAPVDLNSSMELGIVPWETNIVVTDAIIPNVNFLNALMEATKAQTTPTTFVRPSAIEFPTAIAGH